jgi:UDP-glucose 4-epimerase
LRILVTGGAGFVGLPLCERLYTDGHDVLVVDNLKCGKERAAALPNGVSLETLDIRRAREFELSLDSFAPDALIHLAAIHFIPECNRNPVEAIDTNVIGTEAVLNACRQSTTLKRVFVTSSAAVYPISDEFFSEGTPEGPTDVYGYTKAVNEKQAQRFSELSGVPSAIVRLYNVYGPGETSPHVIPEIVAQIKRGSTWLELGNTTPKRSYVFVNDVVDGFVRLLLAPLPEPSTIVNLGNRDEASVDEVVKVIGRLLGKDLTIKQGPDRVRASERPYLRCDPTKLASIANWRSAYSLVDGLRALLVHEQLL